MISPSETSPQFGLPLLAPAQARKHVTVNEALLALDALAQISVSSAALAQPPDAPEPAERFIVASGATQGWTGHDGAVAEWRNGRWEMHPPAEGWLAWDQETGRAIVFTGGEWSPLPLSADVTSVFGINTQADATNRLAVRAPATLLSHEGTDHRVAINRAGPADTSSIVFQTGFDGEAEIGMAGESAFSVKTKTAGGWKTAIRVDPDTAAAEFPGGGYDRWGLNNLFDDGGTFCGVPQSVLKSPSSFQIPPWMRDFNGSVLSDADSFHAESVTNGGKGPANGPLAQALAERVLAPSVLGTVRGFRTLRVSAGNETTFGHDFGDGVSRYLALLRKQVAVPAFMTYSLYLLAEDEAVGLRGDAGLRNRLNGGDWRDDLLVPADGQWHHVLTQSVRDPQHFARRDGLALNLYMAPGSRAVMGFVAALPGQHDLPDTIGQIPSLVGFYG